jgi:hypothetical protein
MQKMRFKIKGVAPLLMHNGDAANPRGQYSAKLKELNAKRKKTEETLDELLYYQYLSGLYVDGRGRPCVPGHVIEATLLNAAKKTREGQLAKEAMFCTGDWPLTYKGPKAAKELARSDDFRLDCMVRIPPRTGARVLSTRPKFEKWELEFVVTFNSAKIDDSKLVGFVREAGESVGLCDWRPRFGRFDVVGKPRRVT